MREVNEEGELEIQVSEEDRQLQRGSSHGDATTGDLVAMAISRDLDIDKLRALIEMRNKQEEREAKRAFDEAFARMKAEFTPVERTKQGDKAKYATIEAMQMQFDPIIHRHGFAYWWDEETVEGGGIVITLTISGHGHAKSNSKYLPPYEPQKGSSSGKAIMNELQAEGVRSSYGRRYTFIAGFGITVRDEDPDGEYARMEQLLPELEAIREADTLAKLKDVFFRAYEAHKDNSSRKILTDAKDKRKKELGNG